MIHPIRRSALYILAGGLIVILVGPFLIPVPPLADTYPPTTLAGEDDEFIEINGLDIHIRKMGQGTLVFVLLHGFAASVYSWDAVMQPLSQMGTVIAFDRVGFGLTERPLTWRGLNPYSAEAQVDLVLALLDHFGIQQAILVGHSAGGTIAMQAALSQPERVSGLILVDPAVYAGHGSYGWLRYVLSTPQMRHLGPLIARQILKRGPQMIQSAWHDPTMISPETLENYLKPTHVKNWDKALWEFTLASRPNNLPERLDELTLPVLVVTGDDDRIIPTTQSIRLANELPNASLVVVGNSGHLPHEEKPEEFMQAVTRFLEKNNLIK